MNSEDKYTRRELLNGILEDLARLKGMSLDFTEEDEAIIESAYGYVTILNKKYGWSHKGGVK